MRSYSRNSGSTSEEIDTGSAGASSRTSCATARSCAGFANELSSETVIASTPRSRSSAIAVRAPSSSSALSSLPSAPVRSVSARVSSTAAIGSGFS
ncbi:MAG TPA: hypothetical protein VGL69_22015 [Solirubrobacteraceae bacterium]